MAGTFTAAPTFPALPGVVRQCGVIALTIVTSGRTYATASGGFNLDLTTLFAAGTGLTYQASINGNDVIGASGITSDGYLVTASMDTTTANQLNVRLYTSGGSEIADATLTKTIKLLIFIAGGSYN